MEIEEDGYGQMSLRGSYYPRWQSGLSPAAFPVVDVRTIVDVRWNYSQTGRGEYFRSRLASFSGKTSFNVPARGHVLTG